jgi:hypothetical protein
MADDFNSAKGELEKLKKNVGGLSAIKSKISERYDKLKNEVDVLLNTALSSPDAWSKAQANQADIIKKIREELPDNLKMLNQANSDLTIATRESWIITGAGIVVLIALIALYITLHYSSTIPSYDKNKTKEFFSNIGTVKATLAKSQVNPQEIISALMKFSDKDTDMLTSEFKERISFLKGFSSTFSATDNQSVKANKTKPTAHKNADASPLAQTDQRVVVIKEEIEKIDKEAKALSKNDGFFWITGYWKWLEIVFWGEFGVIVGILAWVCTQAEGGKYTKGMFERERYWYLAEVAIGPIVVIAVFFLLKQFIGTIITGITEEDVRGSIYMTLGISFALGLFIRRTLGIFNVIKDKLPLP